MLVFSVSKWLEITTIKPDGASDTQSPCPATIQSPAAACILGLTAMASSFLPVVFTAGSLSLSGFRIPFVCVLASGRATVAASMS